VNARAATAPEWFAHIAGSAVVARLVGLSDGAARTKCAATITLEGGAGSSIAFVAGALALARREMVVLVTAHRDEAEEACVELAGVGIDAAHFCALEAGAHELEAAERLAARLGVVRRIDAGDRPTVLVAPASALMQGVPSPAAMSRVALQVREGADLPRETLLRWLARAQYERTSVVESPGTFAVRGGTVDVFPLGALAGVRLDFFGDTIERIFEIDPRTQAVDRRVPLIDFIALPDSTEEASELIASRLPAGALFFLADAAEVHEQARGFQDRLQDGRGVWPWADTLKALHGACAATIEAGARVVSLGAERSCPLGASPLPTFSESLPEAIAEVVALASRGSVVVACDTPGETARARDLFASREGGRSVEVEERHVHRGFIWKDAERTPLAIVPWHEVLHRFGARRAPVAAHTASRARDAFLFFEPGDFVVHRDHGIALYRGLVQLPADASRGVASHGGASASAADAEYLALEFQGGATVHVPASRVSLVQRYVGAGSLRPQTSTLGGKRWRAQKADVEEAVKDLAATMMRVQAVRDSSPGIACPADTPLQLEFEAEFPFQETPDQALAIAAAKRDMERPRPMDRLVCGDVGFGKTEVALRAAFKCVDAGRQVAILVPTTVLAEQHERTFSQRLRGYPIRVAGVSRFKGDAEIRETLDLVAEGRVDIVIGTHRLLSKDVRFKDLGLVVIDEEQRFGVEHKQRLLEFRMTADVLTLSATPIPRTLHMAMLGLRDISSLTTPPPDRRAIVTEVMPFSMERLAAALARELAREGQVFWVHNRVHDIDDAAEAVRRLAPAARILIGHGQMADGELESVMRSFMAHEADILVSTTIVESGIDIPRANTMIIDDAHRFGLAELHQLRGRVGRSSHRAYCYLLLPNTPVAPDAMKRLRALEDYSMLGAGFRIAVRDLEIRGAGNLLGSEQSGHIAAVGYEMYCQMLDAAVREMRRDPRPTPLDTIVDFGVSGALSKAYIPSDRRRLEAYRRLADAGEPAELDRAIDEIISAYGDAPEEAMQLFRITRLRLLATLAGVTSIRWLAPDVVFSGGDPNALLRRLKGARGSLRAVDSDRAGAGKEVFWRPDARHAAAWSLIDELTRRFSRV